MHKQLITYAERVRGKYLYEIDDCRFKAEEFLKAKFINDQNNIKKICKILYKKQK
jgi:hypothetical protein